MIPLKEGLFRQRSDTFIDREIGKTVVRGLVTIFLILPTRTIYMYIYLQSTDTTDID